MEQDYDNGDWEESALAEGADDTPLEGAEAGEEDAAADKGEDKEEGEEPEGAQHAASAPPPPPPVAPPPLPDWLQRSIAGVPPPAPSAGAASAPSPAAAPPDLAAMLSQQQLRATVVVEKQVVETPQDELRRALTRRMSNKALAKKDEIAALVAKLKDGRFRSFDELARLVQQALHVQNEVGNIELIKMVLWPLDLVNSLKGVVDIIINIRRNMKRTEDALRDQGNKGLAVNEQAVQNIRDCVRVLRETEGNLRRADEILGMLTVSVPLQQDAILTKTNALIETCVNVVLELALSKYMQPIPHNSFNLRYRINLTLSLLQTALVLWREAGVQADQVRDKRKKVDQAILDMQHKYADILHISAMSTDEALEQQQLTAALAASEASSTPALQGSDTLRTSDDPSPSSPLSSSSSSPAPPRVLLRQSSGASSRFLLHNYIAQGLAQKVSAYVSGLKETEGEDNAVAELSKEDNRARTPMEVAILQADVRAVQELLSLCSFSPKVASFIASYRNGEGSSYLHLAASISPSLSSSSSSSPSSPSPAAMSILTVLVDNLSQPGSSSESTPSSPVLSSVNHRGETLLHCAAKAGNAEAVRYLVEKGVPLFEKDKFGRTALSLLALKCVKRVTVLPPGQTATVGLPGLNRYFMSPALSDVAFNVRGTLFPAHRIILCAQSPSFKSMLENKEWKEAHKSEVQLEDVSPAAFKHLLEYLYCGESSFATGDVDLALDILHASDRFLVDGMKDKCQYVLFRLLTLENAFLLYTRASVHSALHLREATAHFILTHYDEIAFADEDRAVLADILQMCGAVA